MLLYRNALLMVTFCPGGRHHEAQEVSFIPGKLKQRRFAIVPSPHPQGRETVMRWEGRLWPALAKERGQQPAHHTQSSRVPPLLAMLG